MPTPRFQERNRVERRLTYETGDTIFVHNEFGNVRASAGPQAEVLVVIGLIAGGDSKRDAEDCLRRMNVAAERQGHRLNVSVTCPGENKATQFQVDFELSMPAAANLRIENSYGSVTVDDIEGVLTVRNRFGSASVHNCQSADIINACGDVDVSRLTQGVTIANQLGNTTVRGVTGKIRITNESGNLRLANSGGTITLENKLGELNAIQLTGRFKISSSEGDVTFQQSSVNPDTVVIVSSNGMIHLLLPAAPSAQIDAKALNGIVETSFPGVPRTDRQDQLHWTAGQGLGFFDLETNGSRILIDAVH